MIRYYNSGSAGRSYGYVDFTAVSDSDSLMELRVANREATTTISIVLTLDQVTHLIGRLSDWRQRSMLPEANSEGNTV